jgi:large subunit ribosomal protein L24
MLKLRKKIGNTIVNSKVVKIQKKDKVIVLSGKDRGKISEVIDIKKGGSYVKLADVKIETHFKKDDGVNKGGIETMEGWIHISNVAHVTADGKPTKVRTLRENGRKKIYSRKTGEELRVATTASHKVKVEDQAIRKEKADLKKEQFQEEKKTKEAGVISKKTDSKKKGNL